MRILVVQPYFVSAGHHAQELLDMARVLRNDRQVEFLICLRKPTAVHAKMVEQMQRITDVRIARWPRGFPRLASLFALAVALGMIWRERRITSIVFADVHLPTMALALIVMPVLCLPRRLHLTYLGGPEKFCRWLVWKWIMEAVLRARAVRLSVRTEELASAWRLAFPSQPPEKFTVIRRAENFDNRKNGSTSLKRKPGPARFGVFGEIRRGKSLEWLVPMFAQNPSIGDLHVAGAFANNNNRKGLLGLLGRAKFSEGYLDYDDLCRRVAEMDCLLLLYDNWDCRMEAASLFMAAKEETPVMAYDCGWLGRMCREYRLGMLLPLNAPDKVGFFVGVPVRGSKEHEEMIEGLRRFRHNYSSNSFRKEFLEGCGGQEIKA